MAKLLLTKKDVADLLCISQRKLEKMVAVGQFLAPCYIGDLPRWRWIDVERWVLDHLKPGYRI